MYVLMFFIHLLSTIEDVNVIDDCCTEKVMESSTKLISSILQVITWSSY